MKDTRTEQTIVRIEKVISIEDKMEIDCFHPTCQGHVLLFYSELATAKEVKRACEIAYYHNKATIGKTIALVPDV